MDFKLNYLKKGKNLSSDIEKASYVNEMLKELEHVNDEILLELTLKKLSLESGLDIDFLRNKIKKEEVIEKKPIIKQVKTDKYEAAEKDFIYYMLRDSRAIMVYNDNITNIRNEKYRILARKILQFYKDFGKIDLAAFLDTLINDDELLKIVGDINSLDLKDDITKEDLLFYAKVIQEGNYKDKIKELEIQMNNASSVEEKVKISEEIRKLNRRMKDVK